MAKELGKCRIFKHPLSEINAIYDKDMTSCLLRRKDINMDQLVESFKHSELKKKLGKQHIDGMVQYYLKSDTKLRMSAKLMDKRLRGFKSFIGITGHYIMVHILKEEAGFIIAFEETYINRPIHDLNLFLVIAGLKCDKSLEEMMSEGL